MIQTTFKTLWFKLKEARDAIRAGVYEWPPEVVPRDVLLGVIDGDGSVHKKKRDIVIGTMYPEAILALAHRAGVRARAYRYDHQTVPTVVIPALDADQFDTIKRR